MPLHQLTPTARGSGQVTLPKGDLRRDGLVDENDTAKARPVTIDRVGKGEYLINVVDPDAE